MSDNCTRCSGAIFAAEKPVRVPGCIFHDACFKCKKLSATPPSDLNKAMFAAPSWPWRPNSLLKAMSTASTTSQEMSLTRPSTLSCRTPLVSSCWCDFGSRNIPAAPDANQQTLGIQLSEANHQYGAGAVAVEGAKNAPKAPTTVGNVNNMEVRHQGTAKFTSS